MSIHLDRERITSELSVLEKEGGKTRIDYSLSINSAEHIGMMEGTLLKWNS